MTKIQSFRNSRRRTSVIFAARCYARADLNVMRCLSVCVSEDHVKMNKHIIKIISPLGSHTTRSFSVPNGIAIFRRDPPPLTEASNAVGVGGYRDSEPISEKSLTRELKQQKSKSFLVQNFAEIGQSVDELLPKRLILLRSTLTLWQCAAKVISAFLMF